MKCTLNQVRDLTVVFKSKSEFLDIKLPNFLESLNISLSNLVYGNSEEDIEKVYRETFCSRLKEIKTLRKFYLDLLCHSGKPWISLVIDSLSDELESFDLTERISSNNAKHKTIQTIKFPLERFTRLKKLKLNVEYRGFIDAIIFDKYITESSLETLQIPFQAWNESQSVLCPAFQDKLTCLKLNGDSMKIQYFDLILYHCRRFQKLSHLSLTDFDVPSKNYRFFGKKSSYKDSLGGAILKLVASVARLSSITLRLQGISINRFKKNVEKVLDYVKRIKQYNIEFFDYEEKEETTES